MSIPAGPRYSLPIPLLLDLSAAVVFFRRRSFRRHALWMAAALRPPLGILGVENIPRNGPGVVTVNHYSRPGFWSPWFAAAVSEAVPADLQWLMASAWTYPGRRFGRLYRALSQLLLGRVAAVYGFHTMPPMPPSPREVTQRASSVRRFLAYFRSHPDALAALAPEGGDHAELSLPPPGFGRFALMLAGQGIPYYPAGVYEQDGRLVVRFGPPYHLAVDEVTTRDQLDLAARRQVMQAIARCLPEHLRGAF